MGVYLCGTFMVAQWTEEKLAKWLATAEGYANEPSRVYRHGAQANHGCV